MLYAGNVFGDYQILLNHRATETYAVFGQQPLFTHCLDRAEFLDMMRMFPNVLCIFFRRAVEKRVEIRRIKKVFEYYTGIETGLVLKNQVQELNVSVIRVRAEDRKEVDVRKYTEEEMPRHLSNPDYYFRKFEAAINMQNLELESESEKNPVKQTIQDADSVLKQLVDKKIVNLNIYMDALNEALTGVTASLQNDLGNAVQFFKKINKLGQREDVDCIKVDQPTPANLQQYIFNMYCKLE